MLKLFNNNKKTVVAIALFVLVFLGSWFVPSCSHAADFEFAAGSTFVRGPAAALAANVVWPKILADRGDIYCGLMLIGQSTFKDSLQSNQAAVRCGIVSNVGPVGFGLGAVALQHSDAYNSGKINFNLNISYKIKQWEHQALIVRYDHISNAGTSSPNYGRDMAFLVVRFK